MPKAVLLHQETGVTPLTLGLIHRGFHGRLHGRYLRPIYFKNSFIEYKHGSINWYGNWPNFEALGEKVIGNILKSSRYSGRIMADTYKIGSKLLTLNHKITSTDLSQYDNKKLKILLNSLYVLARDLCDVGLAPVISDLRHDKLSRRLKNILKQNIAASKVNEYYSTLVASARRGLFFKEKLALLKLARKLARNKILRSMVARGKLSVIQKQRPALSKEILALEKSFGWLNFGHAGAVKNAAAYFRELHELLEKKNIEKDFQSLLDEPKALRYKQQQYLRDLNLAAADRRLFKASQDFTYNKIYRFDLLLYTFSNLAKILTIVSERTDLKKDYLYNASLEELNALLDGQKINIKDLQERQRYCVSVIKGNGIIHLTGPKAKGYIRRHVAVEKLDKEITSLHGSVAFTGSVVGRVKIVNSIGDLAKVKNGDILVSIQTNPDFLPAMKKAAAFVTDVGGITSHAAIVARELKKPCLIGTKYATQILKDGDMVEVDASRGIVRKLN